MAEEKKELTPDAKARLKAEYDREWRKELRKATPLKDRMKAERRKMPERPPEVRNRDFREVNQGLDAEAAQAEARRCWDCANPQCVSGCPVGIDIPSFVKLIEQGKFLEAAWKLKETNSLPAICGRVCPQETQCEDLCNVKKATGTAVAIGNLERFAADFERNAGQMIIPPLPPATGRRAAVIGAGPAGLTVAGDLAKLGHKVTIFEALHISGGVLVYGIPEFRLPKAILKAEVEYLKKLGVEIRTSFVVGKTATIEDLRADGFEAFFIASGAGLPNFMKVPGENLVGVYSANEYLTRVNLMKAYDFPNYDTPVFPARRAAIIGGGNVAMDSVRTAKRLGAERAMIVYRRSRQELPARPLHRRRVRPRPGDGMPQDGFGRARRLGPAQAGPDRGLRVHDRSGHGRRGHRAEPEPAHPPDDPRPGHGQVGQHRRRLEDHAHEPRGRLRRRRHHPRRGDGHPGHGRRTGGGRRDGRLPEVPAALLRRPGDDSREPR
jgi:glutamate synthase (NADPH/NADH) small chain